MSGFPSRALFSGFLLPGFEKMTLDELLADTWSKIHQILNDHT